jgi:hypothetical protein
MELAVVVGGLYADSGSAVDHLCVMEQSDVDRSDISKEEDE